VKSKFETSRGMSGRYFSFNDPNGPLNNEGKRSRSKKKFRNVSQNKKQKKPNGNEQQKQKKPNGNEQQKQKKPNGNEQQKKPNGNEQQKQKKPNGNEQQKQKKPNGNEQQNKKQKKPPKKQQKQKQWDDRVVEKVTGCRQNASGTIEYRCNVVDQSAGAIARYAVWLIGSEVPQALVKAYQDSLSAKRRVKEPPKMDKNAMFAMVLARAHELWAFDFDDMVTILKGEFDPQLVDERIELLPQTNKPIERVKQEPVMESEQKPNRKKRKVSAVSPPSHLDAAGLAAWLRPTAEEAALRSATFERLRERMGEDELVLVGSSAHGLVLPGGDVDVVVVAESSKSVQEVSKAVRGVGNKMVVVKRARVPIVKYVDSKTRIPVDISVSKNGILLNKLLKANQRSGAVFNFLLTFSSFKVGFASVSKAGRVGGPSQVFCGGVGPSFRSRNGWNWILFHLHSEHGAAAASSRAARCRAGGALSALSALLGRRI
jgi:hypothetical protein